MPPPSAAPASKTTTYGIVARDAPTAVILRRGPTRFTRLLRWDLRDDTVRAGQWLIGRVAPGPCGLSPDGELLIYEARKGTQTFTAVSRPPYFTALAFWEYASPWTGGGFFSANEVTDVWSYFATNGRRSVPIYGAARRAPEANHGWCTTDDGTVQKPNPVRLRLRLERTPTGKDRQSYRVAEQSGAPGAPARTYELGMLDWADCSHDGELILGTGGCLYRQPMPRSLAEAPEIPLTGRRPERPVVRARASSRGHTPMARKTRQGETTSAISTSLNGEGRRASASLSFRGGGEEIRTPGGLASTAVFKTAALDHSATPPSTSHRTVSTRS